MMEDDVAGRAGQGSAAIVVSAERLAASAIRHRLHVVMCLLLRYQLITTSFIFVSLLTPFADRTGLTDTRDPGSSITVMSFSISS